MSDQPQRHFQPSSEPDAAQPGEAQEQQDQRVVVLTPEGMGVAAVREDGNSPDTGDERERSNPADLVEEPAKVMRIGSMVKQLLEEVRNAPLDDQGRRRLVEIHHRSIDELKDGLAPELVEELDRITLPFAEDQPATDAELRIAQAQLVGWLEGLFHGIQTAIMAQQMAAQAAAQQQTVRGALPPGMGAGGAAGGAPHGMNPPPSQHDGPVGQYL